MKLSPSIAAMLALAVHAGQVGDLPPLTLPEGVGVNIHFTRGHERDLDAIAAAGFKFIRMDFGWSATERDPGQYRWDAYEDLLRGLEQRGLRAVFILDYSNDLYEKDASPQHAESVAAFARWAGAAARRFQGRRILWEIWNEPNIDFWKPKPDVRQYIALAAATCAAIRANDPSATIVAPASSEFPWEFLEEMFKAGLLEQLDGVSVHPYREYRRSPETVTEDYSRLRSLIERYASADRRDLPILSGEWGYATHTKGVALQTQAAFLARQQLVNVLNRVPLSIWYDWKNDGTNPEHNEDNFGTVNPDLSPKPSYRALQTLTRQLAGCRIVRRMEVGDPRSWVLLLSDSSGGQKLAVWSDSGERPLDLALGLDSPGSIEAVDGYGTNRTARVENGRLGILLTELPSYITLQHASPELTAATCWSVQEPHPRTVLAGEGEGAHLSLGLTNAFPYPIRVEAKLELPEAAARKTADLAPRATGMMELTALIARRDSTEVVGKVVVRVLKAQAGEEEIGVGAERVAWRLGNPLRLRVAPTEQAWRITIENPGAGVFNGRLRAEDRDYPVAMDAAKPRVEVSLPNPPRESAMTAGPFDLLSKSGQLAARLPATRFQVLPATQYAARLDGDSKVAASASVIVGPAPGADAPHSRAFALDYEFGEGWRFVRCETDSPIRFDERPRALGIWVFGDASGNTLRIRLRDASGQTFQPNGPKLDWTGWRWVTFDLARLEDTAHWGGANDGIPRGRLTLDTALLIDGTRRPTTGKIYFAGLTALY